MNTMNRRTTTQTSETSGDTASRSSRRSGLLQRLTGIPAIVQLRHRWQALAGREQLLLTAIAALLVLALLWWLLLQPAIGNWQNARTAKAKWETGMQRVQQAGKQAASLRNMKSISTEEARNAITGSLKLLAGTGQVTWQADTARVTLSNTRPEALAQWLPAVRLNALSLPASSTLTLTEKGWSGTVVLRLPAEQ